MRSNSIHPFTAAKPTLVGFLIVAGIIGALALVPWVITMALLWVAGFQMQALLVFLLFVVYCFIIGSGLILGRPGKGLSANFGG